jgi:hypothetical protein
MTTGPLRAVCLIAGGLFVLSSRSVIAADVEFDDLIGRWCGDTSTYVFSRSQLAVTLTSGKTPKHGPKLQIAGVSAKGSRVTVKWKPEKPGNSTEFELSDKRRELVQVQQTKGDKGSRRVFHRC